MFFHTENMLLPFYYNFHETATRFQQSEANRHKTQAGVFGEIKSS